MLCSYGCGQEANFQTSNGKSCCNEKYRHCPAVKSKNSAGVVKAHADGRLNCDHLNGLRGGNKGKYLVSNEDAFVDKSTHSTEFIKDRILKESLIEYKCESCSLTSEWNGKPIVLELDHINGVNNDNRLGNLRFLCPNCHSQTSTFRGRGNTGKTKVTNDELLAAYQECSNIRQALIKVGLAPKGGNYTRMMRLLDTK